MSLVPTEKWEYKISDVFKGLAAALGFKKLSRKLCIDGLGECIPTRSGRAGIIASLRALRLPKNSRIAVPLYCCPVVFKSIKECGLMPRFIDVEPTTYCMCAEDLYKKRLEVDAIIAVHMFGNMCDMISLQEAGQGKPIIEDCAQSLGSKLKGRLAGSFGTVAVFSFRSGKYLSVGEGGALFSNDAEVRSRLSEIIGAMAIPTIADECTHIALTYIRSTLRSKPLYGLVGHPLWQFYNKRVDYSAQSPIYLTQTYKSDFAIAGNRLKFIDLMIERQRAIAEYYSRSLELDSDMLCVEKPETFYNRYLYPILLSSSEARDFVAEYLSRRQIDTSRPYRDIATVAATHYGYTGDCPKAEKVAKRVLVIPGYYGLKKGDIQHIASCVNAAWAEFASNGHD